MRKRSAELCMELDGQIFPNWKSMQLRFLQLFNDNLDSFPPEYSYLQFIDWCERRQWIKHGEGTMYFVSVPQALCRPYKRTITMGRTVLEFLEPSGSDNETNSTT